MVVFGEIEGESVYRGIWGDRNGRRHFQGTEGIGFRGLFGENGVGKYIWKVQSRRRV